MKKQGTERNYAIDLLGCFFAYAVIMFHSNEFNQNEYWFRYGHLSVEFFLVVSGYLLNATIKKEVDEKGKVTDAGQLGASEWRFLYKKFSTLIGYMAIANTVMLVFRSIFIYQGINIAFIKEMIKSIPDVLLLTRTGITKNSFSPNGVTWYISALFISSFLIYPVMRNRRRNFALIYAPIIAVVLTAYNMQTHGTFVAALGEWSAFSFLSVKRSIAGVCAGVFSYEIAQYIYREKNQREFFYLWLN